MYVKNANEPFPPYLVVGVLGSRYSRYTYLVVGMSKNDYEPFPTYLVVGM